MQFFDLNIPYTDPTNPKPSSKNQTRLKQIIKSMELGYTGIAYNFTITGPMSEHHRCTISPFPLSSIINLFPSLSSSVAFHRKLLGVPLNAPFRQYSRVTVVVETAAQCAALNSGNPVIKSYDIVAVRPLNQNCFDLACQSSQVDLISIDFSEKLPFRLKLPMVKAAIARGVYFEIMYSSLLQDVQVRRQIISSAKLLVDWTRGKNLIVSSAAPSVLELRGPNDVANLLSLLGLSNECAKATISKNCRLLVANVLRKKHFFKESIRVEAMPPGAQTDPKEPWIIDHVDWDPLSSGEGDLVLDDIAKAFAESGKISQTVKGTVLSDCVDVVQSHGLQVKDIGLRTDDELCVSGKNTHNISTSEDFESSKDTGDLEDGFSSLCSSLSFQQGQPVKHCHQAVLPVSSMAPTSVEDFRFCSVGSQLELKTSDAPETVTSPVKLHDVEMQNHIRIHANNVAFNDSLKEISSDGCRTGARKEVLKDTIERLNPCGAQTADLKAGSGVLNNMDFGISAQMQICIEADLSHSPNVAMAGNLPELNSNSVADEKSVVQAGNVMDLDPSIDVNHSDDLLVGDEHLPEVVDKKKDQNDDYSIVITDAKESKVDTMMIMGPLQQDNDTNNLSDETMMGCGKQVQKIGNVEDQSLDKEILGSPKLKRRDVGQVLRFPFKRLLQIQFKKKGRNLKCKAKKRE